MPPNSGVRGYRPGSTLLETPRPRPRARPSPSPRIRPRGRISKEIHSGDTSSSPDPLDVISDDSDKNHQSPRANQESSRQEGSFRSPSIRRKARTVEDRRRGLDKELERLGGRQGNSRSASTLFSPDKYHSHDQEQDLVDDRDDSDEEDDWAVFREDHSKHANQKRTAPDPAIHSSPIAQASYFLYTSPTLPPHPFGLTPTRRFPEPAMVSPSRSHPALDESSDTPQEMMTGERSLQSQNAAIGTEEADLIEDSITDQGTSQLPLGPAGEEEVEKEEEKQKGTGQEKAALESDPATAKMDDITEDIAPGNEEETHIFDETPKEGSAVDVIPPVAEESTQLARDPPNEGLTVVEPSLTIEQPEATPHDAMGSAEAEGQRIQPETKAEKNETAANQVEPVDGNEPAITIGSKMDTAQEGQIADAALADSEKTVHDTLESSDPGVSVPQPSPDTMEVDQSIPEVADSTPALTSSPAVEEGEEELDDDEIQPQSDGILEEDNDVDMEDASATATAAAATPSDSGTPSVKGKAAPKKKTVAKPKSKQAGKAVTTTPAKAAKATKAKSKVDDLKPPAKKSKVSRDTPDSMNGTSVSVASAEMTRQDSSDKVYCVCRKRESEDDDEVTMIECESCLDWFHAGCIGLSDDQVDNIDVYICRSCERSTKQKTVYKQQCKRDGCDKGLKGRNSKFCSDLCAYKYHKTLADSITNKKNLKQITAAFTAYPKPPPVQVIQHATVDLHLPAPPSLEHEVLSVVQSQLLNITSKSEIVRKRQEILRQVIDHAESLGPLIIAVEENRSGKSKRKGGPTEDKQCAWDPRLVLSDDEVRVVEIAGNGAGGAGDGSEGAGVCDLGKRRCDKHSGWQKTISLSLDLEEQQLSRSHASLLEQQEAMIKAAETVKESEQARTAFRDKLAVKRRV